MTKLHAVERLQRAPLSDIPARLRILADEWPEGETACIIITWPGRIGYQFGNALNRAEIVGTLAMAAMDAKDME